MNDPDSGQEGERGALPPVPVWGTGGSSYGDDDEAFGLDKPAALPTLESVDYWLKELPCDASAPNLTLSEPEPSRMPTVRLVLVLGVGAALGALALALGGAMLLFWDPEPRTPQHPAAREPSAAGVMNPKPAAVPAQETNPVVRPKLPVEASAVPAGRPKDTDASTPRGRRGPANKKRRRRRAKHGRKTRADEAPVGEESAPVPLVRALPGLEDLDPEASSTVQPEVPSAEASELPPHPPLGADVPSFIPEPGEPAAPQQPVSASPAL